MRAAIVLAAGASRRFGRHDKLLALLHRRPLVRHAIERAREAGAGRLLVVYSHPRVAHAIGRAGDVRLVRAANARAGLSASLAAGLRALRPIEREALIFLGDMPFATVPPQLRLPPGFAAIRPAFCGRPGHPLLVRVAAARALSFAGDRGLAGQAPTATVPGTIGNVLDVDRRVALRAVRAGSHARLRR